ncbi:hypothetical protein G6F22_020349 [Rhizopus arrhizus]|nr:hypothetical protein G6F22_020349 [Rhizopus arrhizus]
MARRFGADGGALIVAAGDVGIARHHLPAGCQFAAGFEFKALAAQLSTIAVAIGRGQRAGAAARVGGVHHGVAGLADGKHRSGDVQAPIVQFALHAQLVVGADGGSEHRTG